MGGSSYLRCRSLFYHNISTKASIFHSVNIDTSPKENICQNPSKLMSAREGVYQFNKFVIYIHETCNTFALQ